jgi:hypothetical protein
MEPINDATHHAVHLIIILTIMRGSQSSSKTKKQLETLKGPFNAWYIWKGTQ